MSAADLVRKVGALERLARGFTQEQIASFTATVTEAPPLETWPADRPFWLSGTPGVHLTDVERAALEAAWTRMLAGLAFAVSGEEVEQWIARPTLMGRLDRLVQPRRSQRIEGRATAVLERALGGSVWAGVIGIWNAFCSALLEERLDPRLRSDLDRAWTRVMGSRLAVE